ncbi:DMT family transporter [Paenibacillus sp. ACRRY]|uniref:DMT family transporter n=1 Tax=Paenibacillus sp. ACRRY TaxID=2918208 RepID=UPI001EF69969|nr:DMT family transporter [Paenibacillus sp. ACRRY]MCG7381873.1 DMT family transporter [Paenibacillus sp. ACRRY]
MNRKNVSLGTALCLIASMSWGAMFPVAHSALEFMDPLYFSFFRYFFVTVVLVILLVFKEGKSAFRLEGKGGKLLFYGTMGFTLYNFMIFSGQDLMGDSGTIIASIMEALMPMITIVILWFRTKIKPARFMMISILIALTGALLVITNGSLTFFAMAAEHLVPVLFIFIGAVGWVLYSLGGSQFGEWSVLRYSALTCLLGTIVSFFIVALGSLFGLLQTPDWHTLSSVKYQMTFMVIFPGLIALLSWNAGIKMLSTVNGILFMSVVPVTTFVLMALQGYKISMNEFYGALLVIFALIQNNYYQRKSLRSLDLAENGALKKAL